MSTIHNPVNFEPSHYEVEDYVDNRRPEYVGQGVEEWRQEIEWWQADMARLFGAEWVKKIHHCAHCGNSRVRYITAVRHLPSNEVVVFGADCTGRLGFADRHAWKLAQIKAKAEAGHARLKIWKQREAFVAERPEVASAIEQAARPEHAHNHFVQDVLGKLNRFGSISDRQIAAVVKSLAKDLELAARKQAEAAEVKGDAPEGRVEVAGVIVARKVKDSAFGVVIKLLIKLDNNAKVWVTEPSASTGEVGDRIVLVASFERSADDKSFAFGKRPYLVRVEKQGVAA